MIYARGNLSYKNCPLYGIKISTEHKPIGKEFLVNDKQIQDCDSANEYYVSVEVLSDNKILVVWDANNKLYG